MNRIVLIASFFFICSLSFSQTKTIRGRVSYQNLVQKNIDVVNFNTRKATQTNANGEFEIDAKANDVLYFMSSNFADQKYRLAKEDTEKSVIEIILQEKPIPLEEVEITQVKAIRLETIGYDNIKMAKIEKDAARPKVQNVYTGEIENGADLIQIGRLIGKLFKSNKPKEVKAVPIPFKDYAKANFNQSFFTKTLKLKPDQTERFIEFCQADPNAVTAMKSNDELTMLEFLLAKKTEFDKLK
ncbi:hypothetical protein [Flavobacterium sp.]